jgi:hypothetical protein
VLVVVVGDIIIIIIVVVEVVIISDRTQREADNDVRFDCFTNNQRQRHRMCSCSLWSRA